MRVIYVTFHLGYSSPKVSFLRFLKNSGFLCYGLKNKMGEHRQAAVKHRLDKKDNEVGETHETVMKRGNGVESKFDSGTRVC